MKLEELMIYIRMIAYHDLYIYIIIRFDANIKNDQSGIFFYKSRRIISYTIDIDKNHI